jgi:hypothetical protein
MNTTIVIFGFRSPFLITLGYGSSAGDPPPIPPTGGVLNTLMGGDMAALYASDNVTPGLEL